MRPQPAVHRLLCSVVLAWMAGCAGATNPTDASVGGDATMATDVPGSEEQASDTSAQDIGLADRSPDTADSATLPTIDVSDCGANYVRFRYRLDDTVDETLSPCLPVRVPGTPFRVDFDFGPDAVGSNCWVPVSVDVIAQIDAFQGRPNVVLSFDPRELVGHYPAFYGPGYFPFDGPRTGIHVGSIGVVLPTVPGLPSTPTSDGTSFASHPRYAACNVRTLQGARRFGQTIEGALEAPCDLAQFLYDGMGGAPTPTPHVLHLLALAFRGPAGSGRMVCANPP